MKKISFYVCLAFLGLCILCLFLTLASEVFISISILMLAIFVAMIAVYQFFAYLELKNQIREEYPLYLLELYNQGIASKLQVESEDKMFYNTHKKNYRALVVTRWAIIIVALSITITLICAFFNKV